MPFLFPKMEARTVVLCTLFLTLCVGGTPMEVKAPPPLSPLSPPPPPLSPLSPLYVQDALDRLDKKYRQDRQDEGDEKGDEMDDAQFEQYIQDKYEQIEQYEMALQEISPERTAYQISPERTAFDQIFDKYKGDLLLQKIDEEIDGEMHMFRVYAHMIENAQQRSTYAATAAAAAAAACKSHSQICQIRGYIIGLQAALGSVLQRLPFLSDAPQQGCFRLRQRIVQQIQDMQEFLERSTDSASKNRKLSNSEPEHPTNTFEASSLKIPGHSQDQQAASTDCSERRGSNGSASKNKKLSKSESNHPTSTFEASSSKIPAHSQDQQAATTDCSERQGSKSNEKAVTGLMAMSLAVAFLTPLALYVRRKRQETFFAKAL